MALRAVRHVPLESQLLLSLLRCPWFGVLASAIFSWFLLSLGPMQPTPCCSSEEHCGGGTALSPASSRKMVSQILCQSVQRYLKRYVTLWKAA